MAEEGFQRVASGGLACGHRQRRQRLVTQRMGIGDARVVSRPHLNARGIVQTLAQQLRRQVQRRRRQQRAFHIVAALLVAVTGLRPERDCRFVRTGADHRQAAVGQVVEQGRGALEEQRQVVLDAGRGQPGFQVLIQRTAPGIDIETLAQRGQHAGDAGLVHRHFAAGQHVHRLDLVQRTLAFRIEGTDGVDVLVQQLHPQRLVGAHREHVEQAAAHREVTRVHHLRHVAVAGAFQAALLGFQVQALADLQVEAATDHVAARGQLLQQGLHRHDHQAALQRGQAVQGGQALRDDVRMRAEAVVGQGFPVRESDHRQGRVAAEQGLQVGFKLVGAVVVTGDHQQRRVVRTRGLGQVPGQGGRRGGGAPPGAELAGARQRRGGV